MCTTKTASSPSAATPPWCRWRKCCRGRTGGQRGPAIWHRGQTDEAQLKKLLEDHNRWTGSKRARELLDNWAEPRQVRQGVPHEYKRALGEIHAKKVAASQADAKAKVSD
jgi:hypothetical protein